MAEGEGEGKESKSSLSSKVIAIAGSSAVTVIGLLTVFFQNGGTDLLKEVWTHKEDPSRTSPTVIAPSEKEIAAVFQKALQIEEETKPKISEASTSEESWSNVIQNWQKAIQLMRKIPSSDADRYSTAKEKLQTYQNQLLYAEALKLGSAASNLTEPAINNTLSEEQWQKIEKLWKQAKEKLNAISTDDPIYSRVGRKLEEYKRNEIYAHQAGLAASWLQGVRVAQEASNLFKTANTPNDWIKISGLWQQAIELMQSVPSGYVRYNEAIKKISEYQNNLRYSQQQTSI